MTPHVANIVAAYGALAALARHVAFFRSPPAYTGDVRCDLHPRWSRDGRAVCVDSTDDGTRQVYVLDVGAITAP